MIDGHQGSRDERTTNLPRGTIVARTILYGPSRATGRPSAGTRGIDASEHRDPALARRGRFRQSAPWGMDAVVRARALASVVAMMGVTTGCLSRVEGHCGNNGGDAACAGAAAYCDLCTLVGDGCVVEPPRTECRALADHVSSSGSAGSGSSGGNECAALDAFDAACPAGSSYCVDGTCEGCTALAEDFCAAADPSTPVCDDASGLCVACTPAEPFCADIAPFCAPDLECRGCWKHEQCPDSACDLHAGTCMPATAVVWVDDAACPGPGTGSESDPFCELQTALLLPVDVLTVRLRAGSIYEGQLSVGQARTIAVRGEDGRPRLSVAGSYAVNVANGAQLLLAGLDVLGGNPAINCGTAALWLEDVVVQPGAGNGIVANNCELHVHRSRIIDRDGHAIELRGRSELELRSSILGLNGQPDAPTHAVYVRDEGTASIVYSTLAANRGSEPSASIACEATASAELRNSIAVSLVGDSIECAEVTATRNVVDEPVEGEANVEVAALTPAWFMDLAGGDFHLADVEDTPFGGLAVWQAGDPYEDVDGDPRGPAEAGVDVVGADAP
jgi:hypothetical protein